MVMDLSMKLKVLRVQHKLTQKEVAQRISIDSSTISGYENGSISPSAETLGKLANVYNTTSDYLLGLDKRRLILLPDKVTDQQFDDIMSVISTILRMSGIAENESHTET